MSALDAIPAGLQHSPVIQAFKDIAAERDLLLAALQHIADTDSRCGVQMKDAAAQALEQLLEARIDARINERTTA